MPLEVYAGEYVVATLAWRNTGPVSLVKEFQVSLKNRGRNTILEPQEQGLPDWTPSTCPPGGATTIELWNRIPGDWANADVDWRIVLRGKEGALVQDWGAAQAPIRVGEGTGLATVGIPILTVVSDG